MKHLLTDDDEARRSHQIETTLYQEWIRRFDSLSRDDEKAIVEHIAEAEMPVPLALFMFDAGTAKFAAATVKHLRRQLFSRFDAVLLFTRHCNADAVAAARAAVKDDPRFTVSAADLPIDNRLAERRCVLLAEGGVLLREHALYLFLVAAKERSPCLVYADEDHLDAHGIRRRPRFKPSFSPELLRRTGYTGPCLFLHDIEFDAARILREREAWTVSGLTEALVQEAASDAVIHVPFVLYHDARSPRSPRAQPVERCLAEERLPSVSVIIPTKDRLELLQPCLASLEARTRYPRAKLEIVVIDNGSTDPATLRYLRETAERGAINLLRDEAPFNYSRLNNLAARQSTGEVLVFLNNDTVVNDPSWLELLVAQAMRDDAGAVGAKLLYPDQTVQFAGTIVGLQGVAGHAHVGLQANDGGYCGLAAVTREVGAVTGACLAIRRTIFDEVGGLDTSLAVGCNDVLFCCDLLARGYRNLFLAQPLFIHCESKSRGGDDTREKIERAIAEGCYLRTRHKRLLQNDPYYSPNLSYERAYDIAFPPRRDKPWRKYVRRRGDLRVLMLSNLERVFEDEPAVLELQAGHLARLGHEVFVGSSRARPSVSHQGYQFVRLGHPIEAAAYAVANDIDCIVVHTSPFFSVVRWIGDWPRCILCDYGEQEASLVEDAEIRRRQEVERQFCLAVADRVFTISEGRGGRALGGEANLASDESLAEFAAIVEAACRS
ncbi:glycosyltransferase family 2 protein [Methyloceanibacter sp.]|uniref:glycosyltransferase family 2 protein n=1 Tax=Methyloceanibacter sp. TaxID=1965321 RepID=UPI003D6CCFDB